MQPENENPAGQGGAPKNTDQAGASINSDDTQSSLREQATLDRLGFLVRDLEPQSWSSSGLRKLADVLRTLASKAEAERYRRLPPAETGTGLLSLLEQVAAVEGGVA